MSERDWPPAFTVTEIQAVCGPWSRRRLKRVLKSAGILDATHTPALVHETKLREHFPDIWQRLYEQRVLDRPGPS